MELRFGLGSWSNAHFDHILYPLRTPHAERLRRYASVFPVVEADILHHQMPDADTLHGWVADAPEGFRFLPKMHKAVTHAGPVRQRGRPGEPTPRVDPAQTARRFLEALEPLEEADRLGPVLLQYAKDFTRGDANISALEQVLALRRPGTFAVELRHPSWWTPEVRWLLGRHRATLVWSTFGKAQVPPWRTGSAGYVRFVGTTGKTRDRWVTRRDGLEDVLEMRTRLAQARQDGKWPECFVVVTNRFEGNAVDSLPRIAAALGDEALARRCARRPAEVLFPAPA